LNFGNPYNPEVYYQFSHAILGMKAACEHFGLPVTGGNVSFYNQSTDDGPVFPTPTIGMVGLLEKPLNMYTLDFKQAGDVIVLLGKPSFGLAGSEYVYAYHGVKHSPCPALSLDTEAALQTLLPAACASGFALRSVHDVADGGLWLTLLESAMPNGLGFKITNPFGVRADAFLFSEDGGRVVVSVAAAQLQALQYQAAQHSLEAVVLGEVTTGEIEIAGEKWGSVAEYREIYQNALNSFA
jgi:phosphoribosylformylglycinamidine synthase